MTAVSATWTSTCSSRTTTWSAHQLIAEIYRAKGNGVLEYAHLEGNRRFLEAQLS